MTILYWILEYAKVMLAYAFLFFIWPTVIFDKKLKNKSLTFRFAFCAAVMPVIISTVILGLGLFHLLYKWLVVVIFYGLFLFKIYLNLKGKHNYVESLKRMVTGTYGAKNYWVKIATIILQRINDLVKRMKDNFKGHIVEYGTLGVIVLFGVIYYSYGAFQDYSFGFGDCYTHNAWISGLLNGQIFSAGVYPEGMHCVIYAISVMFGIRVFSVLLFLQGMHSFVFLVSVYILLKEVFRFKYSPHIVLTLFLTLDLYCIDMIYGMSRLQWTIPQEFALYTPFLCAAFFVRFIKSDKEIVIPEGPKKKIIFRALKGLFDNDDMLVFSLSIATSLAVHFYPTIIAIFLCIAFVPVVLVKVFKPKNFVVLASVAILSFLIAVVPMAGALASGIPFQGSIGWAMSVMYGEEEESTNLITFDEDGSRITDFSALEGEGKDGFGFKKIEGEGPYIVRFLNGLYKHGYETLYGPERAVKVVWLSVFAFIVAVICRIVVTIQKVRYRNSELDHTAYDNYFSIIFGSLILTMMYCATYIGLPALIAGSRLCTSINIFVLATCIIPLDALISIFKEMPKKLADLIGPVAVIGVYIATQVLGVFHGYLYYELTRYNAAVMTTKKITDTLPYGSFTIVSTVDELYQLIDYGFHEELVTFANECVKDEYTLPTEYVFIYVEKHPLKYAQFHFFEGPDWLAKEKYKEKYGDEYSSQCPGIIKATVSPELSRPPFEVYPNSFKAYKDFFPRTVLESRINEWCREFADLYPDEMHTFYEDEDFVCYYFRQNPSCLYQLAFQSAYPENNAKGIWDE